MDSLQKSLSRKKLSGDAVDVNDSASIIITNVIVKDTLIVIIIDIVIKSNLYAYYIAESRRTIEI